MTMITPRAVATGRRADHKTPNWVGAASTTGGPFRQTRAYWALPKVSGESNSSDSVVVWAGIGGYDGSAMWQGGSTQDSYYVSGQGWLWENDFWFELIASNSCCGAVTLYGFNLQTNDQIVAQLWVGDANGNVTLQGDRGWWYMANQTKGIASYDWGGASYHQPFHAGTPMTGGSVEWVAERPLINNNPVQYAHLANFGTMFLDGEADTTGNNTWYWYGGLSPVQLGMYRITNGTWGAQLASAFFYDVSHIRLQWLRFY